MTCTPMQKMDQVSDIRLWHIVVEAYLFLPEMLPRQQRVPHSDRASQRFAASLCLEVRADGRRRFFVNWIQVQHGGAATLVAYC